MKVTAQELRIGNYVWDNYSGTMIVSAINPHENLFNSEYGVYLKKYEKGISGYYDLKDVKPIELTEDWLMNFGFSQLLNQYKIKPYNNSPFVILELEKMFRYDDLRFQTELKYVHQLQNLYRSLTNKELCTQKPN